MSLEKVKVVAEILKNLSLVLAVVLAGWWAVDHCRQVDRPLAEVNVSTESDLEWAPAPDSPSRCLAHFTVTVKNAGARDFEIGNAKLRVWLVDPNLNQTFSFVDIREYQKQQPVYDSMAGTGKENVALPFKHAYAPGLSSEHDYTFSFSLDKQDSKIAIFQFDAEGGAGVELHEQAWSYLCELTAEPNVELEEK